MFDSLVTSLTNKIAREGITEETTNKVIALTDTLLNINDYNNINVTNIQTLLLLLQDFEIKPTTKRLIEELKYRLIRISLGPNWQRGVVVTDYTTTVMNRNIATRVDNITVFEDGSIEKTPQFSIQPLIPDDMLLLNDLGQIALHDVSIESEIDVVLSRERFETPRVGCCGLVRTDMIYPIGETCEESEFIREALGLAKGYGVGSRERTADTYSIEYFIGRPGQNLRESGDSLFLFELRDDQLWHYSKNGLEIFAKDLKGVEVTWQSYLK